jgi:hypothetical protein
MDNSNVPVKLFSLAIVLSISTLQVKETDFQNEEVKKETSTDTGRFQTLFRTCKNYALFAGFYMFKPVPTIVMVSYIANKPSLLSLLLLIGLLSSIAKSHDTHWWSKSYQMIGSLATYALIVTYSA